MEHILRPATELDIRIISPNLRQEDEDEVVAASGLHPSVVLPLCSEGAWVWCLQGKALQHIALYGVTPLDETSGAPWMVATDLLSRYPVQFVKFSTGIIKNWSKQYKLLTNCVDARNELHIKWLKRAGFTFTKLHPEWGAARLPFWQFEKRTNV